MSDNYAKNFCIEYGKLVYLGNNEQEVKWLKDINVDVRMLLIDDEKYITGVRDFAYLYGDIIIPKDVEGIRANAFYNNNKLTGVDFSQNTKITKIPDEAFRSCTSLKTIIFSDIITEIGIRAFYECTSLDDVIIPNNIEIINDLAFGYCSSLENIKLPENNKYTTINYGVFYTTGLVEITIPNNINILTNGSLDNSGKLKNVVIKNKDLNTLSSAFSRCVSLEKVIIGDENRPELNGTFVTYDGAIYTKGYESLILCPAAKTSLDIHINTKNITNSSLSFCNKLESLVIPKNVNNIHYYSQISTCSNLKSLSVDSQNITYASLDNTIYTKDMKTLIVASHANIEMTLPQGLENINRNAFYNNNVIQKIDMSKTSIKIISVEAFYRSYSLKEIIFPSTLKEIGNYSFSSTSLVNITLPEGLETIMYTAFYNCSKLESVSISSTVTTLNGAFQNCMRMKNFDVSKNSRFASDNKAIYTSDYKQLLGFFNNTSEYIMPNTVEIMKIHSLSFGLASLKNIKLSDNLKTIENLAISYCYSISTISIPSSIESIGTSVFKDCTNLKEIKIKKPTNSISGAPWEAPYGINAVKWNQ